MSVDTKLNTTRVHRTELGRTSLDGSYSDDEEYINLSDQPSSVARGNKLFAPINDAMHGKAVPADIKKAHRGYIGQRAYDGSKEESAEGITERSRTTRPSFESNEDLEEYMAVSVSSDQARQRPEEDSAPITSTPADITVHHAEREAQPIHAEDHTEMSTAESLSPRSRPILADETIREDNVSAEAVIPIYMSKQTSQADGVASLGYRDSMLPAASEDDTIVMPPPVRMRRRSPRAQLTRRSVLLDMAGASEEHDTEVEGELPLQFFGMRYKQDSGGSNLDLPDGFFGKRQALMMEFEDDDMVEPTTPVAVAEVFSATQASTSSHLSEFGAVPVTTATATAERRNLPRYLQQFQPFEESGENIGEAAMLGDDMQDAQVRVDRAPPSYPKRVTGKSVRASDPDANFAAGFFKPSKSGRTFKHRLRGKLKKNSSKYTLDSAGAEPDLLPKQKSAGIRALEAEQAAGFLKRRESIYINDSDNDELAMDIDDQLYPRRQLGKDPALIDKDFAAGFFKPSKSGRTFGKRTRKNMFSPL